MLMPDFMVLLLKPIAHVNDQNAAVDRPTSA